MYLLLGVGDEALASEETISQLCGFGQVTSLPLAQPPPRWGSHSCPARSPWQLRAAPCHQGPSASGQHHVVWSSLGWGWGAWEPRGWRPGSSP